MKKTVLLLGFIFLSTTIFSQNESLNDYKYVVVPSQYSFLKEADQYQLNSLTKFLFNKYGFEAIMDTEQLPDDAATNNCLVLKSDVLKEKAFLKTKLKVELKNCKGEIVYTSQEGESREKDYQKAYYESIRDAFTSFQSLNYKYTPKSREDVYKLVKNNTEPVNTSEKKPLVNEKTETKAKKVVNNNNTEVVSVLYAQVTTNGYQLVDTTPKVVYILLETKLKDVFVVKDQNAIVYKEEGRWFLSNSNTQVSELNIKF